MADGVSEVGRIGVAFILNPTELIKFQVALQERARQMHQRTHQADAFFLDISGNRKCGKSIDPRSAHPLDQKRFQTVILVMSGHHHIGVKGVRSFKKRFVASLARGRFYTVTRFFHAHIDDFKFHTQVFSHAAAKPRPFVSVGA